MRIYNDKYNVYLFVIYYKGNKTDYKYTNTKEGAELIITFLNGDKNVINYELFKRQKIDY